MQDVHISDVQSGPDRHVEVTGVDFYGTIEQVPGLHRYYELMAARVFDIYNFFKRGADYLVQMLRSIHTGVLPAYTRWFVAGLLLVVWVVTMEGQ
jgi:hypothetical protein